MRFIELTVLSVTAIVPLSMAAECWNRGANPNRDSCLSPGTLFNMSTGWCKNHYDKPEALWQVDDSFQYLKIGKIDIFDTAEQCISAFNDAANCSDTANGVHDAGFSTWVWNDTAGHVHEASIEVIFCDVVNTQTSQAPQPSQVKWGNH